MPSRGTQSLRKYGRQRTSTETSGRSCSASSSRFLPMKHQGQTTSETTSMTSGSAMGLSFVSTKVGPPLLRRNHALVDGAREERVDGVARAERRQRDGRSKPRALGADCERGRLEYAPE